MVLMAVDHSSALLNRGRVLPGSRNLNAGASSFPVDQFFLRWATHICPVIFIFLAGVSIVLMAQSRAQKCVSEHDITLALAKRGLVIVLLDFLWLNLFTGYRQFHLDVLTAIGSGFVVLSFVRRWPPLALGLAAALLLLTPEYGSALGLPTGIANAAFDGGRAGARVFLNYPLLPWIGLLACGTLWGRAFFERKRRNTDLQRFALVTLLPLLPLFFLFRGLNGFGNAHAPRIDDSLQQWLNVSKNPPSLAFLALELPLLGSALALFSRLEATGKRLQALTVFGQNALFFYVVHFPLLGIVALLSGTMGKLLIPGTLLGAAILVLVMYPLCRLYARYKRSHDNALTRYI